MASPTDSRNKSWPYEELFFSELSGNLSKSIGSLERSEAKAMLLLMCSDTQCQPSAEQEVLSVSGHQLEDMKALTSPESWNALCVQWIQLVSWWHCNHSVLEFLLSWEEILLLKVLFWLLFRTSTGKAPACITPCCRVTLNLPILYLN